MKPEVVKRIAWFVAHNPGRSTGEIAELADVADRYAGKALTEAQKAGLVGYVRVGGGRWWPAGKVAEVEAELRQAQARKTASREEERKRLVYLQRIASAGHVGESGDVEQEDPWLHPTRRRASASAPLPFVCTAAPSVFHLGAGL